MMVVRGCGTSAPAGPGRFVGVGAALTLRPLPEGEGMVVVVTTPISETDPGWHGRGVQAVGVRPTLG